MSSKIFSLLIISFIFYIWLQYYTLQKNFKNFLYAWSNFKMLTMLV